jgi:hypothetical protein
MIRDADCFDGEVSCIAIMEGTETIALVNVDRPDGEELVKLLMASRKLLAAARAADALLGALAEHNPAIAADTRILRERKLLRAAIAAAEGE